MGAIGRIGKASLPPCRPSLSPLAFGHLPLTRGVGPWTPFTEAPPETLRIISGAQNLSGFLRLHPGHWALARWKIAAAAIPQLRLALPSR